ncbi:MAG: hypothetical protein IAG10_25635 [Planctomycetaceae bacterium]|nr:hypothetical protein [Planctomycetaceae bacterium]
MGEPLFDGISLAVVFSGGVAVLLLRLASNETTNTDRERRLSVIGHLWLGIAVSLLLYRWIDAVTSLPAVSRPNLWGSGALSVTCGIGLVAAVKAVIGGARTHRVWYFAIAATCGAVALSIAAAWEWALLVLALLTSGLALAMWISKRAASSAIPDDGEVEQPREPVLVLLVSAALLLLLLGTWQHVVDNETQRKTRSPRYSAWPRPTALRDAWERTDWTAKQGDADSDVRAAKAASHEQLIALGLGVLLLVVATVAWHKSQPRFADAEVDHAD